MRKLSIAVGSILIGGLVAWPALAQGRGGQGNPGSGGQSTSGQGQSGGTVPMGSPAQSMSSQTGQNAPVASGINQSGRSDAARSSQTPNAAQSSTGQPQQSLIGQQNQSGLQGQGSQSGSTLRDQNRSDSAISGQSVQNQSDAMQRFRDQQRSGDAQSSDSRPRDGDNRSFGQPGTQLFSDRNNNRNFRFDDRPEFRNSLRRRGLPADDWRVVFHNGGYWFWTPNRTWLYYDNGDWVPFRAGIRVSRPTVFPFGYPRDDWRLVNNGGRWWFWTPNQTWLYYDNGTWVDYQPGFATQSSVATVGFPPGYPQDDWRLVFHNNRWWFFSPDRTWLIYDGGRWSNFGTRQTVGFRGVEGDTQRQIDSQFDSSTRQNLDTPPSEARRDQTLRQQSQTFDPSQRAVGGTATSGTGVGQATTPPPGTELEMNSPAQPPTPGGSAPGTAARQIDRPATGAGQPGAASGQASGAGGQSARSGGR